MYGKVSAGETRGRFSRETSTDFTPGRGKPLPYGSSRVAGLKLELLPRLPLEGAVAGGD